MAINSNSSVIVASQGFEYGVKHFNSPADGTATHIIAEVLALDSFFIQSLVELGSIYINNQRLLKSESPIFFGALIRVHTKPRRYFVDYDWKNLIFFENKDFLILNKPSGIPSHPSVDNKIENSLTQTEMALKQKLHISHRLDTTTSGLIVYGKTPEFVKSFNAQLQNRTITKKYIALINDNQILPSRLIHYMEYSKRAPKKVSSLYHEAWDECELVIERQIDYILDEISDVNNHEQIVQNFNLLEINLLTGRTHQIRAQLSEAGSPLVGDQMYGSKLTWAKNKKAENQIALKSCFISLTYDSQFYEFELAKDFKD